MKKRVSVFIVYFTLVFGVTNIIAEEVYSIADFEIGTLFRAPDGSYNDLDSFLALSEKRTPGGLSYEDTKRAFPGGKDYWLRDHTVFGETVFFDLCDRNDVNETEHPILTIWELTDGERFGLLWRENRHGEIEPYTSFKARSIPDALNIKSLDVRYTVSELRNINPFILRNEHTPPNGILALFPYGFIHSIWYKDEVMVVYSHLIDMNNGETLIHYRDYYLENRLKDFIGVLKLAFIM